MLLSRLFRMFTRPKPLIGGGEGRCDVVDSVGRVRGSMWFERPTSDMRLNYIYEMQEGISSEINLKKIKAAKDKAKACHNMILNEVALPYAEKIFVRSEGYLDDGKPLENKPCAEQFAFLSKYFSHNLTDMVSAAFEVEGTVKKKS